MRTRIIAVICAASLCITTTIALGAEPAGAVSDADIQAAQERLIASQGAADAANARLAAAQSAEAKALTQVRESQAKIEKLLGEQAAMRGQLDKRAVHAYKNSGNLSAIPLIGDADGDGPVEQAKKRSYLKRALAGDDRQIEQMGAIKEDLDAEKATLDAAHTARKKASATASTESAKLRSALASAQGELSKLQKQKAAEDAARAAAAAKALAAAKSAKAARHSANDGHNHGGGASYAGGGNCPVAGAVSFSNTYGAPRSGGRSHKGVDMMAAHGTPIRAITGGTVIRTGNGGLGGITITLKGDNGQTYYYAHNSRNTVSKGQRVSAGQVIGYVGGTGNANGNPHLHFEVSGQNPYHAVKGIC